MSEKVYCENCKYFRSFYGSNRCIMVKEHIIEHDGSAILEPGKIKRYIEIVPEENNKNNDCGYYKQSIYSKIKGLVKKYV